jgi:hypothetical protein
MVRVFKNQLSVRGYSRVILQVMRVIHKTSNSINVLVSFLEILTLNLGLIRALLLQKHNTYCYQCFEFDKFLYW